MLAKLMTDLTGLFAGIAVFCFLCGCAPQKPADILPASNKDLTRLPMTETPEIDQVRDLAGSYDLVAVGAARYARPGSSSVAFTVQAYQMPAAEDALGLFTMLRCGSDGQEAKVGEDSFMTKDAVTFWKGRYVVRVRELATGDPKVRKDLMDMAKQVAGKIRGEKADIRHLDWLPKDGRKDDSLRYVKHNIMDVDLLEKAAVADYLAGDVEYQAFICSFKTPIEAAMALDKLHKRMEDAKYSPTPMPSLQFRHATQGNIMLVQADRYIVGTTAGQAATAAAIAQTVLEKARRTAGRTACLDDCDDYPDRPGIFIGVGFGF